MKKIALHNMSVEFWFGMENTWFQKYMDGGPKLKRPHIKVRGDNDSCVLYNYNTVFPVAQNIFLSGKQS